MSIKGFAKWHDKVLKIKGVWRIRKVSIKDFLFRHLYPIFSTMKKKNRTAIYMRVSTIYQNHDLQKDGLVEYAARADLEIVGEYLDNAISGKKEGRPALKELMKAARNREFDTVLVWKFDRFAPSVSHLLRALETFNHLNIRFVSVQDQIDTDSPMGKAMFTIIGAMAELESSLISERVKAGMTPAKSRGKKLGRPEIENKINRAAIEQIVKRVRGKEA